MKFEEGNRLDSVDVRKVQTITQSIERLAQAANYSGNIAQQAAGIKRTLVDFPAKSNGVDGPVASFMDQVGKTLESTGIVDALVMIVEKLESELNSIDNTLEATRSILR